MTLLTRQEAIAAGFARSDLEGGRLRTVLRGVYTDSPRPTVAEFAAAVRLVLPEPVVATGESGLALLGVAGARPFPFLVATRARSRRSELRTLPWRDEHGAGREAPAAVALADARLPMGATLALADAALRQGLVTPAALASQPRLSTVASIASPLSESPMESRARLLFWLLRLPAPLEQFVILDEDGRFVARVDFAWPEYRVIVEYEGQQHATDTSQWVKDIARYERLGQLGWRVIRITAADLRQPQALADRLVEALRAGGFRGKRQSGLRPSQVAHIAG